MIFLNFAVCGLLPITKAGPDIYISILFPHAVNTFLNYKPLLPKTTSPAQECAAADEQMNAR
jgi:hypothetical protein